MVWLILSLLFSILTQSHLMADQAYFESLRWKYRVLVLSSPDRDTLCRAPIVHEINRAPSWLIERDLTVFYVVDDHGVYHRGKLVFDSIEGLQFADIADGERELVLLIGKDGTRKDVWRLDKVTPEQICRSIDAMPMRLREEQQPHRTFASDESDVLLPDVFTCDQASPPTGSSK